MAERAPFLPHFAAVERQSRTAAACSMTEMEKEESEGPGLGRVPQGPLVQPTGQRLKKVPVHPLLGDVQRERSHPFPQDSGPSMNCPDCSDSCLDSIYFIAFFHTALPSFQGLSRLQNSFICFGKHETKTSALLGGPQHFGDSFLSPPDVLGCLHCMYVDSLSYACPNCGQLCLRFRASPVRPPVVLSWGHNCS